MAGWLLLCLVAVIAARGSCQSFDLNATVGAFAALNTTIPWATSLTDVAFDTPSGVLYVAGRSHVGAWAPGGAGTVLGSPTQSMCLPSNDTIAYDAPLSNVGAVALQGSALFVADGMPSSRVLRSSVGFVAPSLQQGVPLRPTAADTIAIAVGAACSFVQAAAVPGSPHRTAVGPPVAVAVHPTSGAVYFTQRDTVIVAAPAQPIAVYFGRHNVRGSIADTFNLGAIRLNRTTSRDVRHLAFNNDGRTLYVAERGMHLVRSIDTVAGTAVPVLSPNTTTLVPPFPPPVCNASCHAHVGAVYGPTAIAYHIHAVSGVISLFVASGTFGSLFRLDVVAGTLYRVGPAAAPRMPFDPLAPGLYPRGLSASPTHLFIATGRGLYALTVSPPRPDSVPAPSIPPVLIATGTGTAVTAGVVGAVVTNPFVASQATRGAALLALGNCETPLDEQIEWTKNLVRTVIGDTPFRFYLAAVVGNIGITMGLVVLHVLAVGGHWVVINRMKGKPLYASAAALRFPSMATLPLFLLLEGTMMSAIVLLTHDSGFFNRTAGLIGVLCCVAPVLGVGLYTVRFLKATFIPAPPTTEPYRPEDTLKNKAKWVANEVVRAEGEWKDPVYFHTKRFGGVFKDYRPETAWFAVLELGMALAVGVIDGIKAPGSACRFILGVAVVLYTGFVALLLILRPFTSRLARWVNLTIAGLQALGSWLLLIAQLFDSETLTNAATAATLGSLFVLSVMTILGLLIRISSIAQFILRRRTVARRTFDQGRDALGEAMLETEQDPDIDLDLDMELDLRGSLAANPFPELTKTGPGKPPTPPTFAIPSPVAAPSPAPALHRVASGMALDEGLVRRRAPSHQPSRQPSHQPTPNLSFAGGFNGGFTHSPEPQSTRGDSSHNAGMSRQHSDASVPSSSRPNHGPQLHEMLRAEIRDLLHQQRQGAVPAVGSPAVPIPMMESRGPSTGPSNGSLAASGAGSPRAATPQLAGSFARLLATPPSPKSFAGQSDSSRLDVPPPQLTASFDRLLAQATLGLTGASGGSSSRSSAGRTPLQGPSPAPRLAPRLGPKGSAGSGSSGHSGNPGPGRPPLPPMMRQSKSTGDIDIDLL